MIPQVSKVPNRWDALTKAYNSETKHTERPKTKHLEPSHSQKPLQFSDPFLGKNFDIRI